MINSTLDFFLSASLLDDHSRVRLQALEGEQSSDYINANYVDVSTHTSQHHQRKGHCASPREDGGDAGAAVTGGLEDQAALTAILSYLHT